MPAGGSSIKNANKTFDETALSIKERFECDPLTYRLMTQQFFVSFWAGERESDDSFNQPPSSLLETAGPRSPQPQLQHNLRRQSAGQRFDAPCNWSPNESRFILVGGGSIVALLMVCHDLFMLQIL